MRIELMTPSLPRKCSTPELHRQYMSGRRDSNPRPSAWKANALPTELLPLIFLFRRTGIPPAGRCSRVYSVICGESRIRTYEVIRQQIYSLPQLAALVSPLKNRVYLIKTYICSSYNEPMKGFEPPTCRLQISCSGQLSYIGV